MADKISNAAQKWQNFVDEQEKSASALERRVNQEDQYATAAFSKASAEADLRDNILFGSDLGGEVNQEEVDAVLRQVRDEVDLEERYGATSAKIIPKIGETAVIDDDEEEILGDLSEEERAEIKAEYEQLKAEAEQHPGELEENALEELEESYQKYNKSAASEEKTQSVPTVITSSSVVATPSPEEKYVPLEQTSVIKKPETPQQAAVHHAQEIKGEVSDVQHYFKLLTQARRQGSSAIPLIEKKLAQACEKLHARAAAAPEVSHPSAKTASDSKHSWFQQDKGPGDPSYGAALVVGTAGVAGSAYGLSATSDPMEVALLSIALLASLALMAFGAKGLYDAHKSKESAAAPPAELEMASVHYLTP